jgi:LuxR family transcriptional regulator, maltose regulon positive regulatory protein
MSTNGSSQTDARALAALVRRTEDWDLEEADASVVTVDAQRSWLRYHQLFAGLLELELELERTESAGLADLHGMAAGRHAGRRTAHATLIAEILSLLGGKEREPAPIAPTQLREQLTESEIRVLRYLPTNLRAPEIASDLCLSVNTIRTHVRHVYEKLAAHSRIEAVERARALGLLAPSSGRP